MPLKHSEESSQKVERLGADVKQALANRFTRRVAEEREIQRVHPSSNKFLLPLLAFIFVVLFTAGSVIFYHKQQLGARVVFDATQKKLLAQYRLYDQWRAPANEAYTHFLPDMLKMSDTRSLRESDLKNFATLYERLDQKFDDAAKIPGTASAIGPGAAWVGAIRSTRSSCQMLYRYKTVPYTLSQNPYDRQFAESTYNSVANPYGYGGAKYEAFKMQVHLMSNAELTKALLSYGIPANRLYDACAPVLKSPPFVPDGLRLDYAQRLP